MRFIASRMRCSEASSLPSSRDSAPSMSPFVAGVLRSSGMGLLSDHNESSTPMMFVGAGGKKHTLKENSVVLVGRDAYADRGTSFRFVCCYFTDCRNPA